MSDKSLITPKNITKSKYRMRKWEKFFEKIQYPDGKLRDKPEPKIWNVLTTKRI